MWWIRCLVSIPFPPSFSRMCGALFTKKIYNNQPSISNVIPFTLISLWESVSWGYLCIVRYGSLSSRDCWKWRRCRECFKFLFSPNCHVLCVASSWFVCHCTKWWMHLLKGPDLITWMYDVVWDQIMLQHAIYSKIMWNPETSGIYSQNGPLMTSKPKCFKVGDSFSSAVTHLTWKQIIHSSNEGKNCFSVGIKCFI